MKTRTPNWSVIFPSNFFPHYIFKVKLGWRGGREHNLGKIHLYFARFASCLFQKLSLCVVKEQKSHCPHCLNENNANKCRQHQLGARPVALLCSSTLLLRPQSHEAGTSTCPWLKEELRRDVRGLFKVTLFAVGDSPQSTLRLETVSFNNRVQSHK